MSPAFFAHFAAEGLGVDWGVLGTVMAGVAVVTFVIRGVGLLASRSLPEPKSAWVAKPPASSPATRTPEPEAGEITPELVAILTAAAATVLGGPVQLTSISLGCMAAQRNWSVEGRREIYLSHRIR